jgi:hypothetical protein
MPKFVRPVINLGCRRGINFPEGGSRMNRGHSPELQEASTDADWGCRRKVMPAVSGLYISGLAFPRMNFGGVACFPRVSENNHLAM